MVRWKNKRNLLTLKLADVSFQTETMCRQFASLRYIVAENQMFRAFVADRGSLYTLTVMKAFPFGQRRSADNQNSLDILLPTISVFQILMATETLFVSYTAILLDGKTESSPGITNYTGITLANNESADIFCRNFVDKRYILIIIYYIYIQPI